MKRRETIRAVNGILDVAGVRTAEGGSHEGVRVPDEYHEKLIDRIKLLVREWEESSKRMRIRCEHCANIEDAYDRGFKMGKAAEAEERE